jgi:glycine betaine/proline transport system permease protein
MNLLKKYSQSTFFFILIFFILSILIPKFSFFNYLIEIPNNFKLPIAKNITIITKWLIEDASLGIFSFKQFTRAIGSILDVPSIFLKGLLATGFKFEISSGESILIQPLSWISIIFIFVMIGVWLKDISLSIFVAISFFYVALFDLWQSTMITFSSIIIAVIIGIIFGTFLGILSFKFNKINKILTPTFDFMQTMPVFAYLVPALMLFGYGPAAALIVTLIYAMPPMARVTKNALDQINSEIVELGQMVGCSTFQMLNKVLLPTIKPRMMLGVNQVIMLTLNMVIIASMIGAGGLGYDVWTSLKQLRIGQGFEAGIAITLVAIVLDRLSQKIASRRPTYDRGELNFFQKYKFFIISFFVIIVTWLIGQRYSFFFALPENLTFSSGRFWDRIIDYININYHSSISLVRNFFFIYLLKPFKFFMLSTPWFLFVFLVFIIGLRIKGIYLGLQCSILVLFIALTGFWEKAMITLYLIGVCVLIANIIGIPIGIIASQNDRVHKITKVIIDTFQTLPAFVYLIPVIMIFSVGDFSAMIAVVLYAIVPAIRYTDNGIRQVPESFIDVATTAGCTKFQILRRVQLPLSLPDIMLGVNQTLMMGLSMLVITALVGTRDLGQETLIALSKVDPGRGITAGICVAFIAITVDRLINAWSQNRKLELGLN